MNSRIFIFLVSLLCFNSMISGQSTSQNEGILKENTDHPVKALYLSTIEAFNAGNLELFLSNFSSDIKMYGTDGMYVGKDALRNRFKVIFQQFPNKRMDIPELRLEVLEEKTVLVHFKWKLFPMGQGPAYSGEGSGLYVLKGDKWEEILEVETVTQIDEALLQNNGR